jgi:pyruvate dehydrogenase E2 component (dihydrolipoamide acetyltransferase)
MMPRLSDSMEEAVVLRWLKQPGDAVAKGEPLVEVETDKATVVYEAEVDGVLSEISVGENETARLGDVIARLSVDGAAPAAVPAPTASTAPPPTPAPAPPPAAAAPREGTRPRATPVARRLAAELGVDLDRLEGTGPGGRISEADVRRAAEGAPAAPATAAAPGGRGEETVVDLTPTQRTIVERMTRSRSEIPEFTLQIAVDMEGVAALRDELRGQGCSPLPSVNDFLVHAAGLALREYPAVNGGFEDGRVVRFGRVNVGIAVATDDALLVPTIFDADRKSVFEIAVDSRALIEKARTRTVGLDDLRDGTFTVSNLGMFGIRRFEAVINPPQAAILAAGAVERRPVVTSDGGLAAGRVCELTLSCDHRVVYGAEAAAFLHRLGGLLEAPEGLVE